MKEKNLVFVLSDGTTKAIYHDPSGLCAGLEMELDKLHEDDAKDLKFTVTCQFMTDDELENLPEFDGF